MTTLNDRLMRKIAAGVPEGEAMRRWELGTIQELRGDAATSLVEDFLATLNDRGREQVESEILRLHTITKPARFRKQTLLLMSRVYDYAHNRGIKTGRRKESAVILHERTTRKRKSKS
jgi:hypothetical protein